MAYSNEPRASGVILFLSARFLGHTGQALYLAAMFAIAGSGGSAAIGFGSVMAATMAAALTLGLAGGALADRLGPGRGYAVGALLRLGAIGSAAWLIPHPAFAFAVAFAYSGASQVFTSAELSLVATIYHGPAARAHSLLMVMQYAGQGLAVLVLAPALYLLGGTILIVAAAVSVYAVLLVLASLIAWRTRSASAPTTERERRQAFAFRPTFSFLASEPRAAYAVGLLGFMEMAIKCSVIALPIYVASELKLDGRGLALVAVPGAIGVAAAMAWASRAFSLARAPGVMRLTMLAAIVAVAALAALDQSLVIVFNAIPVVPAGQHTTSLLVALPAALLLGICLGLAPVVARAVLSDTAPRGQQGRVFAAQSTLSEMIIVLPVLAAGFGTEFAGPRATFALVAVLGVAVLVMAEAMAFVPARRVALVTIPVEASRGR